MNSFELDSGFEVLPSDDQYIGYKEAYKLGKLLYPLGPEVSVIGWSEMQKEHYINGWLYQQWVDKNESSN